MLKKSSVLLALAVSLLSFSCHHNVSVYGLTPGIYHFEALEGRLPKGWTFDPTSYFEFKKADDLGEGDDNNREKLPMTNGEWQIPRYEPEGDDERYFYQYIIQWNNTPFDTLSPVTTGATDTIHDGVVFSPLHLCNESEEKNKDWKDIAMGMSCEYRPLDGKATKKREFRIILSYTHYDKIKQDGTTQIFFRN